MSTTTAPAGTDKWCAIVVSTDLTQTVLGRPGKLHRMDSVPAGLLTDPVWSLESAARQFAASGEGTMLLPYFPGQATAKAAAVSRSFEQLAHAFRERVAHLGWRCTDASVDHASGWLTFTREQRATVHLGLLTMIDQRNCPLFDVNAPAGDIAEALVRYRDAVGIPYRIRPGIVGAAKLRACHNKSEPTNRAGRRYVRTPTSKRLPTDIQTAQPWWQWRTAPELESPGDLVWQRALSKEERAMPYVHSFDTRKQYVAAAQQAELAWAEPEHTGTMLFDTTRAGMWRIHTRRTQAGEPMDSCVYSGDRRLPPWLNPARVASDGSAWVSTPALDFLGEHDVHPQVLDSYTCARSSRIMRPWAESLRDALIEAEFLTTDHPKDCACRHCRHYRTLKLTGNEMFGMMVKTSGLIVRRDWANTVMDLSRYLLLRKIEKAAKDYELFPIQVKTDCVYYPSGRLLPTKMGVALGVAPNIGRLRYDETSTMPAYLAALTDTRRAKLRRRNAV